MALAKTSVVLLASQSIAAGGTKASPSVAPTTVDCRSYYGGLITLSVANGTSAPTAPILVQVQVSPDGTTWRDYGSPMSGDITASTSYSWSFDISRSVMYLRVVAYNNATNAVTVAAELQATTSL